MGRQEAQRKEDQRGRKREREQDEEQGLWKKDRGDLDKVVGNEVREIEIFYLNRRCRDL